MLGKVQLLLLLLKVERTTIYYALAVCQAWASTSTRTPMQLVILQSPF